MNEVFPRRFAGAVLVPLVMTMLSPRRSPPAPRRPAPAREQAGVALAVALVILVVITLLGVTAIRRAQLQSRLSQNAEATVLARNTASANAVALVSDRNLQLLSQAAGSAYSACWKAASSSVPDSAKFVCADPTTSPQLAAYAATLPRAEQPFSYFRVCRDTPAILPISSVREANLSGVSYQFANFSTVSGYDASAANDGVAEVGQTVLQPAASAPGVFEQYEQNREPLSPCAR